MNLNPQLQFFWTTVKKLLIAIIVREQGDENDWNKYFYAMDMHVKEIQPTIDKIEKLIKEYLNEPK